MRLASHLHVSGPLAMVVCGLMIGNGGRALAMSDHTRRYVDMFWELIDEILNAVLFVLIGLEVLLIAFTVPILTAGAIAIVVTLAARWLTVGLPVFAASTSFGLPQGSPRVLAWGGLRGGISVALALSLPRHRTRNHSGTDLLRGGVLDPGSGTDHRPGRAIGREREKMIDFYAGISRDCLI